MARPKGFDEAAALRAAMEAFRARGYEATSLTDLTRCMGIQKASLYGTYGDKWQLFLSALRRYEEVTLEIMDQALQQPGPVRVAIRDYLSGVVAESRCAAGGGCLFTTATVELAPRDPEIAERSRHYRERMTGVYRQALERGKATGEVGSAVDAETAAAFLTTFQYGLSVTLKTEPDAATVARLIDAALSVLD